MSGGRRNGLVKAWFVLLGCLVFCRATAAPEYVTAWPKQVPIEHPDPVLGDKPYWEHWVYSESFARRFAGTTDGKRFSIDKADPELRGKLHALVLRIYKTNLWAGVNDEYPKQYTCEVDVYFESSINLPLSNVKWIDNKASYDKEFNQPSYIRLIPLQAEEDRDLRTRKPPEFRLKEQPVIFATPPDGRLKPFGVREHYQPFGSGLSLVVLTSVFSTSSCSVATPQKDGGSDWLSLTGSHPYQELPTSLKRHVGRFHSIFEKQAFDPGPDPESQGLFRVPRAFHEVALHKAALVKVLNWCIYQRHVHANPHPRSNMTPDVWSRMAFRCEQAENYGRILPDPRYYPDQDGLRDTTY